MFALQIFISNLVGGGHTCTKTFINMYLQTVLRSGLHLGPLVLWWWSVFFCIRDRKVLCFYTSCSSGRSWWWLFFFCFFFKDWSQGDRIVIVQIYIHNFHNHIHHHRCCSADMEKERTSNPGVSPSLKKNKKTKKRFLKYSDVSNVSLFCSLFEWLHPVCGFISFCLSRSLH